MLPEFSSFIIEIFRKTLFVLTYCDFVGFKVYSFTGRKTFCSSSSIPIKDMILKNMLNTSDFVIVIASAIISKVFKFHQNAIATSTIIQNPLFCFLEAKFTSIQYRALF